MVRVIVDLSDATDAEIMRFYGLPGVGRALDAFAHDTDAVTLRVRQPLLCVPAPLTEPCP